MKKNYKKNKFFVLNSNQNGPQRVILYYALDVFLRQKQVNIGGLEKPERTHTHLSKLFTLLNLK